MLRISPFIFSLTIMKVSEVRDNVTVCSRKLGQIKTIPLHSLPMVVTMDVTVEKV
jgi:hypothetical protein